MGRRDGKRVKKLSSMHSLMPHILPKRCDSEVYFNMKFDMTELIKYREKCQKEGIKDLTYFHLFSACIGKIIYNRPLLNRFIINKKYYDRDEVSISYVAKREFNDHAGETMQKVIIEPDDNIFTISDKISNSVKEVRNNKDHDVDRLMNFIGKAPKFIKSIFIGLVKFADRKDLLPSSLTKDLLYYSTAIVANLGSINCGALYHHLAEFGTNSLFITIGEIKDEVVAVNGKPEVRKMCEFGLTIDERIADGFYFAKIIPLFEYMLANPKCLEDPAQSIIELPNKKK